MRYEVEMVRLEDICSIRRGASPRPIQEYIQEHGMPWVKIADATALQSRYIEQTKQFIKESGISKSVVVEPGDLILSNSATPGLPKFMGITACIHDGWLVLDKFVNADKNYIYYALLFARGKLSNQANGSVFQNLKTEIVKKFAIPLPPVSEQKAIASVLSALDAKIELNNRINKNLEEQAQAIFKSWFVDFEPFRDGEFVESELGPIPKGWRVGRLGEIIKTNVHSYKTSSNWEYVNYLDTGNITNNVVHNIQQIDLSVEKLPSRARRIVESGDVIFSSVRPNQNHFGVIMNPEKNMLVSTGFIVIGGESKLFAYYYLTQNQIIETLQAIAEQTVSTYPSIKATDIESLEALLPPTSQVKAFSDTIYSLHKLIAEKQSENHILAALRDTLLPKLMSGKIRVPLEM